jgi:hypothetical protein
MQALAYDQKRLKREQEQPARTSPGPEQHNRDIVRYQNGNLSKSPPLTWLWWQHVKGSTECKRDHSIEATTSNGSAIDVRAARAAKRDAHDAIEHTGSHRYGCGRAPTDRAVLPPPRSSTRCASSGTGVCSLSRVFNVNTAECASSHRFDKCTWPINN